MEDVDMSSAPQVQLDYAAKDHNNLARVRLWIIFFLQIRQCPLQLPADLTFTEVQFLRDILVLPLLNFDIDNQMLYSGFSFINALTTAAFLSSSSI